jgi:hypothetical protein
MTEQQVVDWFVAHPFVRNELLLIAGAVSGLAKADWERFKTYQLGDPAASFSVRVAAWQYFQGILIGGVPPIIAEAWRILGG